MEFLGGSHNEFPGNGNNERVEVLVDHNEKKENVSNLHE